MRFLTLALFLGMLEGNGAVVDPAFPGFVDQPYVSGLSAPTAMAFAPDGRLFVCQQTGQLRVIQNGVLLQAPFLTVNTDNNGERGLLGVAFDPDFTSNGWVYVYYTVPATPRFNRISRFTASGNTAVAGSEQAIFELPALSATNHNGGAIHFGPDGKLYVATGDNATPANAQSLATTLGKILRINLDGTIPGDNPFFGQTAGNAQAIWAMGLRNPYTFAFQPGTGLIYINDVGQSAWEEINAGAAGANYGWPATEGAFNPATYPQYTNPLYAYPHLFDDRGGCAISGGAFPAFPGLWNSRYFFAEYCSGWIRYLDPVTGASEVFARGLTNPVDLQVGPDGALYYLARGGGSVGRIRYGAPVITAQPQQVIVAPGQPATFTVGVTGLEPLSYEWLRNGSAIPGANQASYTLPVVTAADQGAQFSVRVSNELGFAVSRVAVLGLAVLPDAPWNPLPGDQTTILVNTPALTWQAGANTVSFDVHFGTTADPPRVLAHSASTAYYPAALAVPATYYWRIVANNALGSTSSPVWSFRTAQPGAGLRFVPITPCRLADTRESENVPAPFGPPALAAGVARSFPVPQGRCGIPVTAKAYSLNVTVVPAGPLSYLTLWPDGQAQPLVSTLNSFEGRVVSNAAIVPAGLDGSIRVFATNPTHLILDLNGYFTAP